MSLKEKSLPEEWDDSLIGRKVERGPGWGWHNQDGGPGNIGEIIASAEVIGMPNWCQVKWSNGNIYNYPLSSLQFADIPQPEQKKQIAEIEKAMQKHIPGYTYGCEVECIRLPNTKGSLQIGSKFISTTNIERLKTCLESFSNGGSNCGICPDNRFRANFESGCLQAVGYKPSHTTPKAPAESPTLDFDINNFVVEVITEEDGPEAIAFIKSLGIDTMHYEGSIYKNGCGKHYFYGPINGQFNNYAESHLPSKVKIVRYPGQTSHLSSPEPPEKTEVNYADLELAEAEREMQKFIPGFYIGCELEIIRNTGYPQGYVGNKFSTKGMPLERLKSTLESFSKNQRTSGIDPCNTYCANYLPEDLRVVNPKEDYSVSFTPRAEAVMKMWAEGYPATLSDCLVPSGFIMGIDPYLPKEESKDKSDSSFEIEFVNSRLRKSGKKSKINF